MTAPAGPVAEAVDQLAPAAVELLPIIEQVIDGFVWRPRGPRVAAIAVLGQPVIAQALAAGEALAVLDVEHRPVRWAADSAVVVCKAGCGAHPCHTREVLDQVVNR